MSDGCELNAAFIKNKLGSKTLSNITKLSFTDLGISSVSTEALKELGNLEELDLSKNNLKSLDLDGICLPHLKTLNLSANQLSTVRVDSFTAFVSLESLDVSNNDTFEVADKYKLVSISPNLKILDGKDVSLIRNAIARLDATLSEKVAELWREKFYKTYKHSDNSDIRREFLQALKTEVTSGPEMLKSYRDFKLGILGEEHLEKLLDEDPPRKKPKTEVNGHSDTTSETNENETHSSDMKTVQRKRNHGSKEKTLEKKKDDWNSAQAEFVVSHLLQTHSLNNDPNDRTTQVWGCEFEPDTDNPGKTTRTCATCGGDSVCFIDCATGKVVKKYKQPGETFYCLAWTTVNMDLGNGKKRKSNLLAAGGRQKDIKIIEPTQLVCFEEIRGHKGVLENLLFHPGHPTWLLSSADDNTVMVWEVGLPKGTEFESKSKLLVTLKSRSIVRYFAVPPHGKVVVGACDDGCYLWKLFDGEQSKEKTRTYFGKLDFPGKRAPLDCVSCISDNVLATKRVEEGCIFLWHSESNMMKSDLKMVYKLPWRQTEVPFLKYGFAPACKVLVAGDDEGCVWLYNLNPCVEEAHQVEEVQTRSQTQILMCPNESTKVFNQVCSSSALEYVVAVADTNVVCIWRRLSDRNESIEM